MLRCRGLHGRPAQTSGSNPVEAVGFDGDRVDRAGRHEITHVVHKELAAEAADEAPRAAMMDAPRFPTVSQNGPCNQASSLITSTAGLPEIVACANAGNIEGLWLP